MFGWVWNDLLTRSDVGITLAFTCGRLQCASAARQVQRLVLRPLPHSMRSGPFSAADAVLGLRASALLGRTTQERERDSPWRVVVASRRAGGRCAKLWLVALGFRRGRGVARNTGRHRNRFEQGHLLGTDALAPPQVRRTPASAAAGIHLAAAGRQLQAVVMHPYFTAAISISSQYPSHGAPGNVRPMKADRTQVLKGLTGDTSV